MTHERTVKNNVNDFLAHYGVKGMQWGVVNDLDSGTTNTSTAKVNSDSAKLQKREEKAKKFDMLSKDRQTKIETLQAKPPATGYLAKARSDRIKELSKERDRFDSDAEKVRNGKLTSTQKKVIVGASVAAGLLLAYGGYKMHDSGEVYQMINKGKKLIDGTEHTWKTNSDLSKKMNADDIFNNVVKPINPNFGKYGTKMNCRRCTFAYEMRRRGLDVKATISNAATGQDNVGIFNATNPNGNLPTSYLGKIIRFAQESDSDGPKPLTELLIGAKASPWGTNKIDLLDVMADAKVDRNSPNYASLMAQLKNTGEGKASSILNALSKQPDGARGELAVGWLFGGGHSVAWEIIGGKPVIFDNQSGEKFDNFESLSKFAKNVTDAGFTRLDNIPLNDNFLQRWVTNIA